MRPASSKAQQELLEDHLNEASFLWTVWERGLDSPDYTLTELAEGPEARMLAHVDALVLGGPRAHQKLLLPGLAAEDSEVVTAAALALLSSGDEKAETAVLEALAQAESATLPSLRRALELCASPRVLKSLSPMLAAPEAGVQAAALEVMAAWGEEPGLPLEPLLSHASLEVVAAALKVARVTQARVSERSVFKALESPSPTVRAEALQTALAMGLSSAWPLCRKLAEGPAPDGRALLLLGLGGSGADMEWLLEAATSASNRDEVIWALGFSGRVEAAEHCLQLLDDAALGRLAAEAFGAITGLRLTGRYARTPPESSDPEEEDDSGDAEEPTSADKLPLAASDAVRTWWQEHRGRFERGARYLLGAPLSGKWLLECLEHVPMRRRHVLLQELELRSRGQLLLSSRSFTSRQRTQLQTSQDVLGRVSPNQPFQQLVATARPQRVMPLAQRGSDRRRPSTRPPSGRLAITGLGMVSALGDDVIASCAASRAGLSRISELKDVQVWDPESRHLEPARGIGIPWLTEGFSGHARLAVLATEALLDLLSRTDRELLGPRCAFHLCAPNGYYLQQLAEREAVPPANHEERLASYQQRLIPAVLRSARLHATPKVQPLALGETGFMLALQDAHRQLEAGTIDSCIIGGVDSLMEPGLVDALDQLRLLKSPGNPVGLLPGEASAFILVERGDTAVRRGARILATMDAPHVDAEPVHRLSRNPALGGALVRCIRRTLASLGEPRDQALRVIAALNGDSYRATDWGHALVTLRAHGYLGDSPTWYPASSFGETGAASGPLGICMAVRGFERGYLPESSALLWVCGDEGGRGSLLIHSPVPVA
ncbi:hypothetical protein DRW03_32660 [Corallococcus sp. H22C18031201]|uniref:TIGR02270 family protein n=1 Tax=Citreicoccus inhibens TaxID=2849499 RepID=UPI000E7640A3|nr:TIGR02270 family protein [Citreicoccus inhibens]MBU8897966.1 TIGR02270 family protein [Citreicoccus inhibens]RJS15831.1 hypothetical protein DRW03_32660 [Corallococcus sp. H22C18031201]